MDSILKFNNSKVQKLYDIANSDLVANLKNTDDIREILFPLIQEIVNNPDAYTEAKEKWYAFKGVSNHYDCQDFKEFKRMDFESSVSFSLYMYIYH